MLIKRSPHNCQDELRNADLKVTSARLGVLKALEQSTMPLAVSEVMSYLKKHHIKADKATVFRIINSLTDKGVTVPVQFNEGRLRFETTAKGDHHHFVCDNCGSIEDISDCNITELTKQITTKKGLLVRHHSLEFFGLCRNCQK